MDSKPDPHAVWIATRAKNPARTPIGSDGRESLTLTLYGPCSELMLHQPRILGNPTVQTTLIDDTREFRPPQTMTPAELADSLARLVWESFSDFLSNEDGVETPLPDVDALYDDEAASSRTAEETLIFFMWAHTRGAQLAFMGRAPDELIRSGLDAMHQAVFEDMVQNGTPSEQLPKFEERVSMRYAEYHQAAEASDDHLGRAVVRHLVGDSKRPALVEAIRERAVAVANPLRDFLEDVDLVVN